MHARVLGGGGGAPALGLEGTRTCRQVQGGQQTALKQLWQQSGRTCIRLLHPPEGAAALTDGHVILWARVWEGWWREHGKPQHSQASSTAYDQPQEARRPSLPPFSPRPAAPARKPPTVPRSQ